MTNTNYTKAIKRGRRVIATDSTGEVSGTCAGVTGSLVAVRTDDGRTLGYMPEDVRLAK